MSYKRNQLIGSCFIIAAGIFGAGPLSATPNLYIDFLATPATSTENTGVSGRLTLSFSEDAGIDYLTLTITNTTPLSIGSMWTAVGLELPDELTNSPIFAPGGAGPYFTHLNYNVEAKPFWINTPGGYDLMLTQDGNFQGGNPIGAPAAGESHTVVLSLGITPYSPAELSNIFDEFYMQATNHIAIARFQVVGSGGEGSDKIIGVHVPEPASNVLILASLSFLNRRRFRQVYKPYPGS